MNFRKFCGLIAAAALTGALAACSDDNNGDEPIVVDPDYPTTTNGAFVLNQGSYYDKIEGSLDYIDFSTDKVSLGLFASANKRSLGNTPQGGVAYGSKIYLGVYESNTIEIIDRNTFKSLHQISLADAEGKAPRSLLARDGKVYVTMMNGYVSRLDTASMRIDATVRVGLNPEIPAILNDKLYVPNSGGLNYLNGYNNTASVIDLATFTVEETFETPVNPTQFMTDGRSLYLLSKGNYADYPSAVYNISADRKATMVGNASFAAMRDNLIYMVVSSYSATVPSTYKIYDTTTGETRDMIPDPLINGVDAPSGIAVNPLDGSILIGSCVIDNGFISYTLPGYVKRYDAQGKPLGRYDCGVSPAMIFFNNI